MSRPIKFRAWDKERMEYLSGGHVLIVVPQGRGERATTLCLDIFEHPDRYRERFYIEQFTGLHDKNGREIYEGDILREDHYGDPSLFTVEWDQLWARFVLRHDKRAIQYPEWNRGVLMEVIGNIHENKEMMK